MGSNGGSMLVTPTRDGSRPGYYGPDAGFGDDDYKDASADFDAGRNQTSRNKAPDAPRAFGDRRDRCFTSVASRSRTVSPLDLVGLRPGTRC